MGAESQNTGYTGKLGYEKAIHKSHFTMPKIKLRKTKPDEHEWISVGPGKYKRVKRKGVSNVK